MLLFQLTNLTLTAEGAQALAQNPQLLSLNLANTQITDAGAMALAQNTALTPAWNNQIALPAQTQEPRSIIARPTQASKSL